MSLRTLKIIFKIITATVTTMLCISCDVHEFPTDSSPPGPDRSDTYLEIVFDSDEMPVYKNLIVDSNGHLTGRSSEREYHDMRFIIDIFPSTQEGVEMYEEQMTVNETRTPARAPERRIIVTRSADKGLSPEIINLELDPGYWKILVWVDYIENNLTSDKYYNTDDLAQISILTQDKFGNQLPHSGSNYRRDCFRGELQIAVDKDNMFLSDGKQQMSAKIHLKRPLARYHFITTDLNEFFTRTSDSTDISNYAVIVKYTGYMPSAYNAHIDRPVDARLGVYYPTDLTRIDEDRAEIGFDYVFVNEAESYVQVALDLYNKKTGQLLSSSAPLTVPLIRDKQTIISGKFLTTTSSGGIGIDTEFNGDYNIEIK